MVSDRPFPNDWETNNHVLTMTLIYIYNVIYEWRVHDGKRVNLGLQNFLRQSMEWFSGYFAGRLTLQDGSRGPVSRDTASSQDRPSMYSMKKIPELAPGLNRFYFSGRSIILALPLKMDGSQPQFFPIQLW